MSVVSSKQAGHFSEMPTSYGSRRHLSGRSPVQSLVSDPPPRAADRPSLVDGVLRYRRSIVMLSFTEERLMLLLLGSGSIAVSRVDAAAHAAPGRSSPGARSTRSWHDCERSSRAPGSRSGRRGFGVSSSSSRADRPSGRRVKRHAASAIKADRGSRAARATHRERTQRGIDADGAEHLDLGRDTDHRRVRREQHEPRVLTAHRPVVHLGFEEEARPLHERVECLGQAGGRRRAESADLAQQPEELRATRARDGTPSAPRPRPAPSPRPPAPGRPRAPRRARSRFGR